MIERIQQNITSILSNNEFFENNNEDNENNLDNVKELSTIILFVSSFLLILFLFFGKYLWNNILVKIIPSIKPVDTILQFIGLWILLQILFTR
jgi:hypothetical protein